MSEQNEQALAKALVAAARAGTTIVAADLARAGLVPADLSGAMRVQAQSASLAGWRTLGWKVAIGPEGVPIAAPLIDIAMVDDGKPLRYPVAGFRAVEIEIAVELAADLPPRAGRPYSRPEVLERLGAVRIGIEIIAFRLEEGGNAPFPLFLADRLGNGGYVLGPEVGAEMLAADTGQVLPDLTLRADGKTLFSAPARHPNGDPIAPLEAYANAQNDWLGGLRRGQVITTGSLCGAVPVTAPCRLEMGWTRSFAFDLSGH